jgi:hypothetical protein
VVTASWDGTARIWTLDTSVHVGIACAQAGRNFTRAEWWRYFPGAPYRKTCEQWPEARETAHAP